MLQRAGVDLSVGSQRLPAAIELHRDLSKLIFTIVAECYADRVSKVFCEMTLAVESTLWGNFGDRPFHLLHPLLGLFDPLLNQVLVRRNAHQLLFEQGGER